jgi:hypothetical protein
VVGANARAGQSLENRAEVVESGGVRLSGVARVKVHVVGDSVFDRSWVRGRVFCDLDGDGFAGPHDPGVFGARVYVDTGRYAITDRDGKYHLTDLPPGIRMVKIDENTIPPGSTPVTPISKALMVTRGIPQQYSFGFRCSTALVGPSTVSPAKSSTPPKEPDVEVVTGSATSLVVHARGRRIAGDSSVPKVSLMGMSGAVPNLAWAPGGLATPAAFELQGVDKSTVWRLWVDAWIGNKWQPIRAFGAAGRAPKVVRWDGRNANGSGPAARRDSLHRVRFVAADGTNRWHSVPVYFTVGWGRLGPSATDQFNGSPVDRKNRITNKAKRFINNTGYALRQSQGSSVVVRARGLDLSAGLKILAALARVARLDADKIQLTVESGEPAIFIDRYSKGRQQKTAPAVPDKFIASVRVNGAKAKLTKSGRFVHSIARTDRPVAVEIQRKDGLRREVFIDLATSNSDRKVRGALAAGQLSVAGKTLDLSSLRLRVYPRYDRLGIQDGRLELPWPIELYVPVGDVVTWSVKVQRDGADASIIDSGTKRPPSRTVWSPSTVEAGLYSAWLEVELADGAKVRTAPARLEVLASPTGGLRGTVLETLRGSFFAPQNRLSKELLTRLDQLMPQLREAIKRGTLLVEVHGAKGDELTARQMTATRASRIRNVLVARGIPEGKLEAAGLGTTRPSHKRGLRLNRRIEIRFMERREPPVSDKWRLTLNKRAVDVSDSGHTTAAIDSETSQLAVLVGDPSGARYEMTVDVPATEVKTEEWKPPFGSRALLDAIERQRSGKPMPKPLAVAGLQVELPPDGSELGQPLIPVVGSVPKGHQIRVAINGQIVPVVNGRFEAMTPLSDGERVPLVIEAVDPEGNRAKIERSYTVKGNALFLMAMADGAVTQHTTGLDQHTSTLNAGPVLLHGRAALYLKARIKGNELIKKVRITAFADTARQQEFQNFIDQIIDPERVYPVYGDASEQRVDATSRTQYFVAIEADRSKLLVGTFKAAEWGVNLLRYGRTLQGAQLRLQQAWVPGYETVVEGFASFDDQRVRRGQAYFNATGGSFYFLPDREIVEGSETVRLMFYDRDSGARLQEIPQNRNDDYRIDYESGRITFKKPVSSRVDASLLSGATDAISGRLALDGHNVRIHVSYETRATSQVGDVTWGAYGSQSFADLVTVGGGYLREGRSNNLADYELWGAHVKVTPAKDTVVEAEVAHSTARDGTNRISDDGGLSFRTADRPDQDVDQGWGLTIKGRTELGEFLDKDDPFINLNMMYQRQDIGFTSTGNVLEQGQERGTGEVRWHPNHASRLVLRHDTLHSLVRDNTFSTGFRRLSRHLTSAQYTHRFGRFTLVNELLHSLEDDQSLDDSANQGAVALMGRYRITDRVAVFLEQRALFGTDLRREVLRTLGDRFLTTLGVDIGLTKDTMLTLSERIRWSGEDATAIGLRTALSDRSSMYVEQRLLHPRDGTRWIPATVVGSEERWGDGGRSYGEYQTGSGQNGTFNRAVLGIGRRFELMDGFYGDIAFERLHTEVVDGSGNQRDANVMSLGGEYVGHPDLKVSSRFELRHESTDRDRLQVLSLNRVSANLGRGVSLFGRVDIMATQDLLNDTREAEAMNFSLGLAYRPLDDTVTLLVKAARIVDMRPAALDPEAGSLRVTADVISFEPIIELPLRLQLTPKFAYRRMVEEAEGLPAAESHTILAALRVAVHLWKMFDIAAEYRWLNVDLADNMEHGALAELAINIGRYARIGAGYNFTSFQDDLFDPLSESRHGFFVRLTGMY